MQTAQRSILASPSQHGVMFTRVPDAEELALNRFGHPNGPDDDEDEDDEEDDTPDFGDEEDDDDDD